MITEIIAAAIGILLSSGYYFQAHQIGQSKSVEGISLLSYVIFVIGNIAMAIYGFATHSAAIIISFIIGTIGSSIVLLQKLYYMPR